MDKILAPIKQRILQVIDYKGLRKNTFFDKLGISASNFRSKSLYSEVGGDVIAKFSSIYSDINIEWLITGKGDMLKSPEPEIPVNSDNRDQYIIDLQKNQISHLEDKIKTLEKDINAFKSRIAELERIEQDYIARAMEQHTKKKLK